VVIQATDINGDLCRMVATECIGGGSEHCRIGPLDRRPTYPTPTRWPCTFPPTARSGAAIALGEETGGADRARRPAISRWPPTR
jgi:hypothetical protein